MTVTTTESEEYLTQIIEKLATYERGVSTLRAKTVTPFSLPPWPETEFTILFRYLADQAGFPKQCRATACTKTGSCTGTIESNPGKSCISLWKQKHLIQLDIAYIALLLSWQSELRRHFERTDIILGTADDLDALIDQFELEVSIKESSLPQEAMEDNLENYSGQDQI